MRELREICDEDKPMYEQLKVSLKGKGNNITDFSTKIINKINNGEITLNDRVITLNEVLTKTSDLSDYSDFIRAMIYLCTFRGPNAARGVIIHWFDFIDTYTGELIKTKALQKYKKIKE